MRPFLGGMAQVTRPGAKPAERADTAMIDQETVSPKERLLMDVQTILNVDEEAGGLNLDGFLRRTLLSVEKLMDQELRSSAAEGPELKSTLSKIESRLSMIEKHNANQPSKAETYASVARAAVTAAKKTTDTSANLKVATTLAEERKKKEVLVRVMDGAEKLGIRGASDKDILERVQKAGGDHAKKAAAVRWLPSGDVLISMATKEAKEGLEKEMEWTKCLGSSAKVIRRGYGVLAHGIKVDNYDTIKQAEIIEKVLSQNKSLHENLQIIKIAWPINAIRNKKLYSSLMIEVGTPAMANRLVREGLIDDCTMKNCELFTKECRMTQCFNCYQYGHIAKRCHNPTKCGHCARGHRSLECPVQGAKRSLRCAVCEEPGHEAWSRRCRIRGKEAERARAAYEARPRLHPEMMERPATPKAPAARATSPSTAKPGQPMATEQVTLRSSGGTETPRTGPAKRTYNKRGPVEDPAGGKEGSDNLVEWMATANRDRPVARPVSRLPKKHIVVEGDIETVETEEQL